MSADLASVGDTLAAGPYGDTAGLRQDVGLFLSGLASVAALGDVRPALTPTPTVAYSALRGLIEDISRDIPPDAERLDIAQRSRPIDHAQSWRLVACDPTAVDAGDAWLSRRALQELSRSGVSASPLPAGVTATARARVSDAIALLNALHPLTESTLAGAPTILLLQSESDSTYLTPLPGVVVLSTRVSASSVEETGELLFHEALHQKLADCLVTRRISPPMGYRAGAGPLAVLPWNPRPDGPRRLDMTRCLSAYHVYVHLLWYWGMLAAQQSPVPVDRYREYWSRCYHFSMITMTETFASQLGPDASDLASHLTSSLVTLADMPSDWRPSDSTRRKYRNVELA